MSKVTVI